MIGQRRLQEKLNTVNIETFPKSLILSGDAGCGKHLFCSMLEKKFPNWLFQYINSSISYSFVESCYLLVNPAFYIFNADNLTEREQNVLLKLFEEPPENVNIILLSTNTEILLNTIVNRAIVWEFEKYTTEDLTSFLGSKNPELLTLVTTPGQLLSLSDDNINAMIDLSNLIIDKIGNASISNTLSLSKKFFDDEGKNQFDALIFIRLFRKILLQKIQECNNVKYLSAYETTNNFYNNILRIKNINKKYLFENFILELKSSL